MAPAPYDQELRPSPGPQADRPSSAFGIRPAVYASPEQYDRASKSIDMRRPSSGGMGAAVPNARGSNPAERDRVASASDPVSAGWQPQVPPKYSEPSPARAPQLPQIDYGHPLSIDQSSSKLTKPPPKNINKPQPQAPQPSQSFGSDQSWRPQMTRPYDDRPVDTSVQRRNPSPSIQRRDPSSSTFHRPERGSSITPVDSYTRPDRLDSMAASNRTSQYSQTSLPSQGSDPRLSPHAGAKTTPPPSKKTGPSTFEEMGIPAGKNDSDCIMM